MIEFLSYLRGLGVRLWLEEGVLRFQASKGVVTEELRKEISQKKEQIIQFLTQVNNFSKDILEPIPKVERGEHDLCVSYSQQSLWFFDQLNPDKPVYNIPNAIRIKGDLDILAVEAAINEISKRHEILRTSFIQKDGKPVQLISDGSNFKIDIKNLHAYRNLELKKELSNLLSEETWRSFDLEKGPLWRFMLIKIDETDYVLSLTMHHIISDAWSNGIFVSEFLQLYEAYSHNRDIHLPQISIQFADYANWQRQRLECKEVVEPLIDYWKKQLTGYTTLELPTDRPRLLKQSFMGDTRKTLIPKSLTEKIKELCLKEDVTIFMMLTAVFNILLYRYSGQEDILIGTVVANRNHYEAQKLIGFIMNTLVLRNNLAGNPEFKELLNRVKETTVDAYSYQELPFDLLLDELKPERDLSRSPLFQVMYIHQNIEEVELKIPGLVIEPFEIENTVAPFDLRLITQETEEGIVCKLDFCTDLYDSSTIDRLLGHFTGLIRTFTADPLKRAGEAPILSTEESLHILETFNDTTIAYPTDLLIHQLFEKQVEKTPNNIAVIFENEQLTYADLNQRSNQLALYLRRYYGVGPNITVGVCLERSLEMVISLLGILKAGGAYVPFDPNYPKDRLDFMVNNAKVNVIITIGNLALRIPKTEAKLLCLDIEKENIINESVNNPQNIVSNDDLAYIIYTSGSTGTPKGAMNTHLGLCNHKLWMQDTYKLTQDDRVLQKTPFSFDVSVWEFFWPLITGAKLVVAKPEGHKDPQYLIKTIIEQGITTIHFVPSMLYAFLEQPNVKECVSLKQVVCSGEALSVDLLTKFRNLFDIPLHNVYGPAECSDVATAWTCDNLNEITSAPIGKPISNVRVYILDKYVNPVPVGVTGELYVGGISVGKGYINNLELTKERFMADPFRRAAGAKMYKTGDLARFRPDGNIEYIGRVDFQVKIRGLRIELGEIEKSLSEYSGIKSNVIIAWENDNGQKYLVGYIVPQVGTTIDLNDLRKFLRDKLPEYMIPQIFMFLDDLPINPNGKLDRKALPAPDISIMHKSSNYVAPRNEIEQTLANIWKDVIGVNEVGVNDNFFEIGGHSLLLTQVHARMSEVFKRDFSLIEMFTHSTISVLAAFVKGDTGDSLFTKNENRLARQKETNAIDGIAIIGMSGRFPGAKSISEFWTNIKNGVESISFFSKEEARASGVSEEDLNDPSYVFAGGILEDVEFFDADFFGFNPREAENMDPQQRLFLECAYEALENSGYARHHFDFPVGVYAGANMSTYFLYHLINQMGIKDDFSLAIANDKDYLATRVSYEFNLKGPSISIQTACSTSMTAIAMACDGLLNYHCDMAIAGGAAVKLPQKMGYLYQQGMIASPDGHTRPFDMNAQGTIFSSAVGVVVLKRLKDAISDGDHIYAVIKGIAVNNDGSTKVGFTAPSREGQAEVIAAAQRLAGIHPEDISYIEAHGTGTSLGDPIEVAALTKVFAHSTDKKLFCAIGSVKSNIGHAVSAAGAASMIKTALALTHKQIPPSINFETPNPKIDFENSPFYVNTGLKNWEDHGKPRRAGVSSFGFGGTNVHAILEEAPPLESSPVSRPWQMITLSAKSAAALEKICLNLARCLRDNAAIQFADAVYTLHVGRKEFGRRRAIICQNIADAISLLESKEGAGIFSGVAENGEEQNAEVESLLSGGALGSETTLIALAKLWVSGAEIDWRQFHQGEKRLRVSLPTYPFERKRYWAEQTNRADTMMKAGDTFVKSQDNAHSRAGALDWLYFPSWKRAVSLSFDRSKLDKDGCWLVFAEQNSFGEDFARFLSDEDLAVITVAKTEIYTRFNDHSYGINPNRKEDYQKLIQEVSGYGIPIKTIIHAWNVTHGETGSSRIQLAEKSQTDGFYSLLYLAKALSAISQEDNACAHAHGRIQIIALTDHMYQISSEKNLCPEKAAIIGPCKVIPKEFTHLSCRNIDIELPEADPSQVKKMMRMILAEIIGKTPDFSVALRGSHRWVQTYDKITLEDRGETGLVKEGGAYLITGGMGGIGLAIAGYMVQQAKVNLILTRLSCFPEKAQWGEWLISHGPQDKTSIKIKQLMALESSGAQLMVVSADITDPERMRQVVTEAKTKFGRIDGLIHAAGIADNGLIAEKSAETAARVLAPKIKGTLVLDELFKDDALDYMVLFSSSSAVLGNAGFVDYCAANSFLDLYAHYHNVYSDTFTVSINWDEWDEVGMAAESSVRDRVKDKISVHEGLILLDRIVASRAAAQIIVSPGNFLSMLKEIRSFLHDSLMGVTKTDQKADKIYNRPELANRYEAPRTRTEERIADVWQNLLGIYPVGVHDDFFDLGGHSLLATTLITELARSFQKNITLQTIFEKSIVAQLAEFFDNDSGGADESEETYEEGQL